MMVWNMYLLSNMAILGNHVKFQAGTLEHSDNLNPLCWLQPLDLMKAMERLAILKNP